MNDWHFLSLDKVSTVLQVDPKEGLTSIEAQRRLTQVGPNELQTRGLKSPWLIFWEQLSGVMVVLLLIAAAISLALGERRDALAILIIVLLNTALGFSQEWRAEKAMAALKKLATPRVKVRRGGQLQEIHAQILVPGDIILLEAGALVPADCRLIESSNLRLQESILTGESEPVEKSPTLLLPPTSPLPDRLNMAYMGTTVTFGRGVAVVTETGMRTELGSIADMIQTVRREPTPMQRRLGQLARGLAFAALFLVGIVFVLGLLRGEDIRLMLLTSMSMAVAAVPEGLPAVVTITLALGAQRMLRRQALIRKLPAIETLGSVTVICSDKTGTLTENRMSVTMVDLAGHQIDLTENLRGGGPVLDTTGTANHAPIGHETALALLLAGCTLCNDAVLEPDRTRTGSFRALGDPTEGACVVAAARLGVWKTKLEDALPRIAEFPFDSARKRMTTVHRSSRDHELVGEWSVDIGDAPYLIFTKGAVDGLVEICRAVQVTGRTEPMDDSWKQRIALRNNELARNGMRVLGIAFRKLSKAEFAQGTADLERDLVFVGMVGMLDPPRPEVKAAVAKCRTAGIRPVMITGDHPVTAAVIARELGIGDDAPPMTGVELEQLDHRQLREQVRHTSVFARVSPQHKLRLVEAFQAQGEIVAMTGDGVNDAPALKKADIGVAMGITGTDVTKEAADMVLLDDNFATIVSAVEEGRTIYDNVRKFIRYTMTSNAGEIWTMLFAPFLGMPLPLLPLQILWVNLVTDGLPGLALGVEPAERDIMGRPPYNPSESIFGQGMGRHIIWVGVLMAAVCLAIGFWSWKRNDPEWQTLVFTTLTLSQMGNVLAVRSKRDSFWRIGILSNRPLVASVLLTFILQMAVIYLPIMQETFNTQSLSLQQLGIALVCSSIVFWAVETAKWLSRHSSKSS